MERAFFGHEQRHERKLLLGYDNGMGLSIGRGHLFGSTVHYIPIHTFDFWGLGTKCGIGFSGANCGLKYEM
jgi:hypothetical protein